MREEHHTAEHVALGQNRRGHRDGVILRRLDRPGRAAVRFRAHGAAVFHDLLQRLADRFFQQLLFPAAGYGDHAVAVTYGDRPARGLIERFADLCGIAAQLAHGRVFFENDLAVLLRVDLQRVTLADAQGAATHDCIVLAGAMVQSMGRGEAPIQSRYDVYRRVLREELAGSELEALAHEHQIEMNRERCVLTFQILQTETETAFNMLEELVPRAGGDLLVEMDRHTVVFLKSMENVESFDELFQLAEAIEQTLLDEAGKSCVVGIGEPKKTFPEIGESYRESRRAVEVGRIFLTEQHIYVYRSLVLERFLMDIPREMGTRYHGILFNRKTARLFNDEMLHTIEMFFAKDLNLSDTARQLYIHRNTLVYRLDKVQRQTGLDLRKFDDAVTFKMMMLLGKSGKDKPRPVY